MKRARVSQQQQQQTFAAQVFRIADLMSKIGVYLTEFEICILRLVTKSTSSIRAPWKSLTYTLFDEEFPDDCFLHNRTKVVVMSVVEDVTLVGSTNGDDLHQLPTQVRALQADIVSGSLEWPRNMLHMDQLRSLTLSIRGRAADTLTPFRGNLELTTLDLRLECQDTSQGHFLSVVDNFSDFIVSILDGASRSSLQDLRLTIVGWKRDEEADYWDDFHPSLDAVARVSKDHKLGRVCLPLHTCSCCCKYPRIEAKSMTLCWDGYDEPNTAELELMEPLGEDLLSELIVETLTIKDLTVNQRKYGRYLLVIPQSTREFAVVFEDDDRVSTRSVGLAFPEPLPNLKELNLSLCVVDLGAHELAMCCNLQKLSMGAPCICSYSGDLYFCPPESMNAVNIVLRQLKNLKRLEVVNQHWVCDYQCYSTCGCTALPGSPPGRVLSPASLLQSNLDQLILDGFMKEDYDALLLCLTEAKFDIVTRPKKAPSWRQETRFVRKLRLP